MGSPLAKVRAELLGNWLHNDKCIPMGIDASGRQSYHSILNGFHAFDSQPNITLFPLPLSEFRTSETSATTREPEPIYPSDGEVADSEASDDGKKSRVKLCTGGTSPTGSKGGSPAPSAMADFGELAGPEVVGISPKAQPAVETVVKKRCIIFMCGPKNAVDSEPKPAVPVVSQATPVAQKTPNKAPQPQKYTTKFACPGSKPLEKASNTVVYTADSEVTTAEVDVEGHDDSGREVVPSSDTELTRSIQTHKRHKRIVAPAESSRITRPIPEKESVVAPNLEQQKLRDVGLVNGTDLVTDGIALHERARREVGACFNCWIQKSKCIRNPITLQRRICRVNNWQRHASIDGKLSSTRPHGDYKPITPTPENTRKILRVFIKNKEQIAYPDSGSERNIMSESFAVENGLEIIRNSRDIKPFQLSNGKNIWSVGRVKTTVDLLGKTLRRKHRWFYVFATCPVPLILGMPFLADAEILTQNRHMLEPCLVEFSNISSLPWIGWHRNTRKSPCNRMRCTLDGSNLTATADTGSDHNFMCPNCAEREGFHVDTREEVRLDVQIGDGTFAETVGQVYIHDFSLDWRELVTESPRVLTALSESSLAENEQPVPFGTIFHILPGLPCDVILGRDLLEESDAFNRCSDLSCSRTTKGKRPFELNIIISRWKKKRKVVETTLDPKEVHDDERHAEMLRRSRSEDEIPALTGDERNLAKAREDALCKEWDAQHAACGYCHP